MQNEERINGLETQVRTLKRIVCLVCCSYLLSISSGCGSMLCENCRFINPDDPCNRCHYSPDAGLVCNKCGKYIGKNHNFGMCTECSEKHFEGWDDGEDTNEEDSGKTIKGGWG